LTPSPAVGHCTSTYRRSQQTTDKQRVAEAGWAPVVQDLPGGHCPVVVVLLDVQGQPAQQPALLFQLPWRGTAPYGNGPKARYYLGLDIYRNEPIPA
jgi:hypothetical protein